MDIPVLSYVLGRLRELLLSPGSDISIASLISAFVVALLFLAWRRGHAGRPIRLRVLMRALFPRKLVLGASTRADAGFFVLNSFVAGLLLGWAILSYHAVGRTILRLLTGASGPLAPTSLPDWVVALVLTVALFLAYEFGYWLDHYLSHKVPFLWEFHKVHHSAEELSPLTNFRVHPVDGLVFVNIMALIMGLTEGVVSFLFGKTVQQFSIAHSNAIIVVFTYLLAHLHHTSIWIPFTGIWGRILISPAHHQIHHSTNPIHFDRNMGSCLAVFDWLFGTLHVPSKERERLTYGVPELARPHSVSEGLVMPVARAFGHLVPAPLTDRLDGAPSLGPTPPAESR
jgi:sterol desaturase/sphingolipid hydroxylase (fatty acid hydroxylase superfamily)